MNITKSFNKRLKVIDLENFETRMVNIVKSTSFKHLSEKFKKANHIFFIGNGGNLAVCSHAATDTAKYLPQKNTFTPDSAINLSANSLNTDEHFLKWFKQKSRHLKKNDTLCIIITSSGRNNSLNNLVNYLKLENYPFHQVVGAETDSTDNTLSLSVTYYHTAEILSLALFYQLISEQENNVLEKI